MSLHEDQERLEHLALDHAAKVGRSFRNWLPTKNPCLPPSEHVVAKALKTGIPERFTLRDWTPTSRNSGNITAI